MSHIALKSVAQHNADQAPIRAALQYLDPRDRDLWVRMAFALKSELDAEGFDLWDQWGAGHPRPSKEVRATWKSARPGGGVGIGTLFYLARAAGWRPDPKPAPLSAAEIERCKAAAAERAARFQAEETARQARAAQLAERLWKAAIPADTHPYLKRKGIPSYGLRIGDMEYVDTSTGEVRRTPRLIVPIRDHAGKLWSLQFIAAGRGKAKLYLKDGAKSGHFFCIGTKPLEHAGRPVWVLGEGYATCASVHACTGHKVLVCLDTSNLLSVAQQVRSRAPHAIVLIAADNDLWNFKPDGAPCNPGVEAAVKAAQAVGALVAIPPFTTADALGRDKQGRLFGPTDFNDLQRRCGPQAVAAVISAALRGHAGGIGKLPVTLAHEPRGSRLS